MINKRLSIIVGPPGSGKSTLAREYCAPGGVVYVNQDSQGKDHFNIFHAAISDGQDVVVDRMNFSKGQRAKYIDVARKNGYYIHILVLHENYQTCYNRIVNRFGNHETINDEQAARGALNTFFTKYERPQPDEADKIEFRYPQGDKPSAIVCDLDGTLCDVAHRRHFVRREGRKDWQGFFAGMVDDTVQQWCADLLKSMSDKHTVIYCSGRPDSWRPHTVEWLKKHNLHDLNNEYYSDDTNMILFMRPRQDSRQDSIVKEIILDFEILTRFVPYFMIDDRKQVVDMWRSRGYICLQCDEGDF